MIRKQAEFELPCTILVDKQEQLPYQFHGMVTDASDGHRPILIHRATAHLVTGDYSVFGHENELAVERKSMADLFSVIGSEREREERKVGRLNDLRSAAYVVEAEWSRIFDEPPPLSKLPPKNVWRTVLAWMQRYQKVHWHFMPGRRAAELACFDWIRRFMKEQHGLDMGMG